jgi:hypothetical protein
MNQTTPFWKDPAIIGIVVTLLSQVLARYGVTIDNSTLTNDIVSLVGIGITIYDSFKASPGLHVVTPSVTTTPPKQAGFSRIAILFASMALSAGFMLAQGCATVGTVPANTTVMVANDAIAVANLALAAVPALQSSGKISATSAADITRDATAVLAAANAALTACTASSTGAGCSTVLIESTLASLTSDTPATQ